LFSTDEISALKQCLKTRSTSGFFALVRCMAKLGTASNSS
jgi:hypothetical protein